MLPSLSIVIPTYNRAQYVGTAIESCFGALKVGFPLEIIVTDNASQDDTSRVVAGTMHETVRYFRNKENIGPVRNVMQGLRAASGTYVVLLSDDDWWTEDGFDHLARLLSKSPTLGAAASSLNVRDAANSDAFVAVQGYYSRDEVFTERSEALRCLFLRSHILSGLIIRRDLLDFGGAEKHMESLYPQMYLFGRALTLEDSAYSTRPLINHRMNNKVYWEYSTDHMTSAVINIIRDLTEEMPHGWRVARSLIRERAHYATTPLVRQREEGIAQFVNVARQLLKIPEYRRLPIIWIYICYIGVFGKLGIGVARCVQRRIRTS